jgi:threonine/homoserine/homoserine lactone efflux protein
MTIASFLAFAVALAIAAAIPGPGVTALVGRALGTGFWRTLPMLTGLVLGDLTYLVLAVAGLALVAKAFSGIFLAVRVAGAAYLLWIAWKFWSAGIPIAAETENGGKDDSLASFFAGLALTIGNPKTIVFYLAITPAVIDVNSVDVWSLVLLSLITIAVLYVVLLPYVALAATARSVMKDPVALTRLNKAAALAMAATAIFVLTKN